MFEATGNSKHDGHFTATAVARLTGLLTVATSRGDMEKGTIMNTPLGLLVWRWGSSRVAISFLDGVGTRLQARAMGVVQDISVYIRKFLPAPQALEAQ